MCTDEVFCMPQSGRVKTKHFSEFPGRPVSRRLHRHHLQRFSCCMIIGWLWATSEEIDMKEQEVAQQVGLTPGENQLLTHTHTHTTEKMPPF